MGAQQDVGSSVDEEGVLHIAGGVVFGEVERGEYMPVVFDFGAFGNVKSERRALILSVAKVFRSLMACPIVRF